MSDRGLVQLCAGCNRRLAKPQSYYCCEKCQTEAEYEQLMLQMPVVIPA
jgi:hypothetical protein